MQKYLYAEDINDLPVDGGITPLKVSAQETFDAIQVLKKYNLSVYRYYDSYEEMKRIEGKLTDPLYVQSGMYDDGWVGRELIIMARTDGGDLLYIDGYCPWEISDRMYIDVYVNDALIDTYALEGETIHIPVLLIEAVNRIRVVPSFVVVNEPDVRELSFLLTDLAYADKASGGESYTDEETTCLDEEDNAA